MEALLNLIVVLILLALGYGFGRLAENRHYRSIRQREWALRELLLFPERRLPNYPQIPRTVLVAGNVVISVDYFKRFIAGLRNLVGGRVTSYESLLDRGRREAILRMKEEARRKGASAIFNVKLETASISKGQGNAIGSIEVYAYGTAIILPRPDADKVLFGIQQPPYS
ncbi:MAG: YbjQ family protein [Gammaproteobacteria bacterium]|nr:YbjQ family protein [Gammaproteobacteria bacterium]MCP5424270.1 YbjQ family protein [Gammaproteobacteria bacterium]